MAQAFQLDLSGEATIRTAIALRQQLLAALESHDAVMINCAGLTHLDVTLVQALLAARRTAASQGHSLVLMHPLGEALEDVLTRGGFLAGTDPAADDLAFWTEGGRSEP